MKNLLLVIFTFFPLAAFAQTSILERSKAFADSEVIRLRAAITKAAKDPALVPCDFRALNIQLKYNEWFTNPAHYQALVAMSNEVDAAIELINRKLESLDGATVNVIVVKGQTESSEIPVAFKDLIDFFKLYDSRMKACPKNQQTDLIDLMENEPLANPLGIVLSQVRAAGGMMSVNLNASLRESNATYDIIMTPRSYGFETNLQVTVKLNGIEETFTFSLLGEGATKIEMNEKSKWEMLAKSIIDGMPVDGALRYSDFQDQLRGKCDQLPLIPLNKHDAPYFNYNTEIQTNVSGLIELGSEPLWRAPPK